MRADSSPLLTTGPMKDISRRTFLFLTGGTGAAAAVEPGRQLVNKLIPWVIPPENIRPGQWSFFATTCRECPAGCGMHLWHRDGRVTKAEGNPLHPVNVGGLCARGQSALQGLYDPDRLQGVRQRVGDILVPATWGAALENLAGKLKAGSGRMAVISDLADRQPGRGDAILRAHLRVRPAPLLRGVQLRAAARGRTKSCLVAAKFPNTGWRSAITSSASPPTSWKPGSLRSALPASTPSCMPSRTAKWAKWPMSARGSR